jgi:hypothetical protein
VVGDDPCFLRDLLSRRKDNVSGLNADVERVPGPDPKFATKDPRKNNLPFGRDLGFHGKTILPYLGLLGKKFNTPFPGRNLLPAKTSHEIFPKRNRTQLPDRARLPQDLGDLCVSPPLRPRQRSGPGRIIRQIRGCAPS